MRPKPDPILRDMTRAHRRARDSHLWATLQGGYYLRINPPDEPSETASFLAVLRHLRGHERAGNAMRRYR